MKHTLDASDFCLDEIVSIEFIGERKTVDITVEDTHMFFANGVYSHNSGIDRQVIQTDSIADSFAKAMVADFIMTVSRSGNDKVNDKAKAHIAKNRFGPDGMTFSAKADLSNGDIDIFDVNSSSGASARGENTDDENKLYLKRFMDMKSNNADNKSSQK